MATSQEKIWRGQFGRKYNTRNKFSSADEFNLFYIKRYGCSRDTINERFFPKLEEGAEILEVGSNIGNQLGALSRLGYTNLSGIDIQEECVEEARALYPNINFFCGSASDMPFEDNKFDVVFTNNVLIHVSPEDLIGVLKEIHRVSKRYIIGFEYFSEELKEVNYRGLHNLLWKGDYCSKYLEFFDDLQLVKSEKFSCLDEKGTVDNFFVLQRLLK